MPHRFDDYLRSIMPEPGEDEILRRWWNAREATLWQARYAAERSQSYRPFPVGSAVYAFKPDARPDTRWKLFRGSNIKAAKEAPKICAEMTAIMAAMQEGYTRIIGIAVVGNPQVDHGSGLQSETLHPCESCRLAFATLPVVRPDTQLILGRPTDADSFVIEEMSVEELWKIHAPRAGP